MLALQGKGCFLLLCISSYVLCAQSIQGMQVAVGAGPLSLITCLTPECLWDQS